jgi:hypothetical protein
MEAVGRHALNARLDAECDLGKSYGPIQSKADDQDQPYAAKITFYALFHSALFFSHHLRAVPRND